MPEASLCAGIMTIVRMFLPGRTASPRSGKRPSNTSLMKTAYMAITGDAAIHIIAPIAVMTKTPVDWLEEHGPDVR